LHLEENLGLTTFISKEKDILFIVNKDDEVNQNAWEKGIIKGKCWELVIKQNG
jgi:hypothetical protein